MNAVLRSITARHTSSEYSACYMLAAATQPDLRGPVEAFQSRHAGALGSRTIAAAACKEKSRR